MGKHSGPWLNMTAHAARLRAYRLVLQPAPHMLLRRSRMRRTSRGKRLELTQRDIEIFKVLEQYRYLPSTFIHAFVGGASETRFKERLGDLFHEGFLDRPSQQWDFANARHRPAIYESSKKARGALAEAGIVVGDQRTFLGEGGHPQFRHALMICQLLASLDLGVRAEPRLRFIAWPEILERAPERTRTSQAPFRLPVPSGGYLVADGLFGLEYAHRGAKAYRFFALEADRGTMPISRSIDRQTSYLGKTAAYREILARQIYRSHWGIPNLLVLTVTTGEPRMREIVRRLEGSPEGSTNFLFKAVDETATATPQLALLEEAWQRPGSAPLSIAAP
jgi:hypothetical protein